MFALHQESYSKLEIKEIFIFILLNCEFELVITKHLISKTPFSVTPTKVNQHGP